MPLEIRELVIKATVGQDNHNNGANGNSSNATEVDVNLIVEKVLTILKEKSER